MSNLELDFKSHVATQVEKNGTVNGRKREKKTLYDVKQRRKTAVPNTVKIKVFIRRFIAVSGS